MDDIFAREVEFRGRAECCFVESACPAGGRVARGILIAAVALFCGCNRGQEPTYPAGGKLVFPDGEPLTSGSVSFRSLDGSKPYSARGMIQPDGTFKLTTFAPDDGAVEGRHEAVVVAPPPHIRPDVADTPRIPRPVDPRFSNYDTSGLEFTVTRDARKNQFTIQVTIPRS